MKKIMFNDKYGLTQAVLEGMKTMTRRIIPEMLDRKGTVTTVIDDDRKIKSYAYVGEPNWKMDGVAEWIKLVPRYDVGEVVAVAQKYKDFRWPSPQRSGFQEILHSAGWDNKMFVRAELMPTRIRITSVRIERLQDISDEDCLKEGVSKDRNCCTACCLCTFFDTPREAFAALIDKVSGKGTWDGNPWVYVYEFEKVK